MKKKLGILGFLLLSTGVYAATIQCGVYNSTGPGCFVGVYNQTLYNTHAFLCNQSLNYYYYRCYIDVGNGVKIPINFTSTCVPGDTDVMYLYYPTDSHVSLISGINYTICLDSKFSKIIKVYNTYSSALANIPTGSFPVLGLYNYTNSHIEGVTGNYEIYLYIADTQPPNIQVNYLNNSYILLPTEYTIKCSDNSYVYLCKYTILESNITKEKVCYSPSCSFNITLTKLICPKPECTIKITSIDIAGNIRNVTYVYKIINTKLQLIFNPEIEVNTVYDLYSNSKYNVTIKNSGSTKLDNVCIYRIGCEHILSISNGVQDISNPICFGSIAPGDKKNLVLYFRPYRIGRCKLKIIANATDNTTHNPVDDSVTTYVEVSTSTGPFHIRTVGERLCSGLILIVITGIILLI